MDTQSRRLLRKTWFREGLARLAQEIEQPLRHVRRRARLALREMWSTHAAFESAVWDRLGGFFLRNYDVIVDERKLTELNELDAEHPLLVLFSHRSYLDDWLVGHGLHRAGIDPMFILAGANLDFFPLGGLIRRTGGLFIRRTMKGDPVYKYVLRSYLGHLLESRRNIGWSIEGGRTRTGKLRPPRYGVLSYTIDAMRSHEGPEVYVVPVSVVYDQLAEVAAMAAESLGASKRPEGIGWLLRFTQMQRQKGGVARVDFGDPIPLREHVADLEADPRARPILVERVALSVCHRINQATPATPTALVTLALLAAERGLTLDEVMEGLEPILGYLAAHPHLPSALHGELRDRSWVHDTLERLVDRGILGRFEEGIEPVYFIVPEQHLVAAFYRNTLIHFLVVRAIGEFAGFLERDRSGDVGDAVWARALELRDLLKFDFFFSSRREFQDELLAEVEIVDPSVHLAADIEHGQRPTITRDATRRWLEMARPHVAHLVLRPFLDAYRVVADELASWPAEQAIDEAELMQRCLRVGKQRVLQKRLHSPESVTLELFGSASKLARHRGLVEGTGAELRAARRAFADQVGHLVDELDALARLRRVI